MDLLALGAHRHHLVANLHDVGESNFVETLCEADAALLCCLSFLFHFVNEDVTA